MTINYGARYLETNPGCMTVESRFTIKKFKSGWAVISIWNGNIIEIFPTELRARYAASRLNGQVGNTFTFGHLR